MSAGEDRSPKTEDRGGGKGWRRAFLLLWTASFVLLLGLCVMILPLRVQPLVAAAGASKIPLPALATLAVRLAGDVPANLPVVLGVWIAGAAAAFLLPKKALPGLTGIAVLLLLTVVVLGAGAIVGTEPSVLMPRPIPMRR